ncbi:TPA: hypothetical protein N0F65_007121 [Lagenidium giganteum]|uniref:Secreted protein n=1 Tax=Lagenidium giganteum TaxID=4803 RepID=A0AAV2YNQ2_9STRA|nr:TPA: hypothetical protein N0F65_007121 [Lagenidium giganteum]
MMNRIATIAMLLTIRGCRAMWFARLKPAIPTAISQALFSNAGLSTSQKRWQTNMVPTASSWMVQHTTKEIWTPN